MKFLVVDDHPIIRVGIRHLILQEWPDAQVEEADTIALAVRLAGAGDLSVIVLDLLMPDTSGTEGVAHMLRVAGNTPILVLSFNAENAYAGRLLQMGVSGYLPKDRAGAELVTALQRLSEGRRYVTASMADQLVDSLGRRGGPVDPHETLSTQEHRVMLLIASGNTPAEIAETMHLSVKTVGSYRARIFDKTGWKNNIELHSTSPDRTDLSDLHSQDDNPAWCSNPQDVELNGSDVVDLPTVRVQGVVYTYGVSVGLGSRRVRDWSVWKSYCETTST